MLFYEFIEKLSLEDIERAEQEFKNFLDENVRTWRNEEMKEVEKKDYADLLMLTSAIKDKDLQSATMLFESFDTIIRDRVYDTFKKII